MRRCSYINKPRSVYPCTDCAYQSDCEHSGGKEPLTCEHCRYYSGVDKQVCYKRRGYNIRPCEEFKWD